MEAKGKKEGHPAPSYDQMLGRLLRNAANQKYNMTREEVKTLRECARERTSSVSGGAAIATAASAFLAATGGWTTAAMIRAVLLQLKGNAAARLGVVSTSCFLASGWLWTIAARRADNADASAGQCLQKLMILKDSRLGGEAARLVHALKPESMVLREAMETRGDENLYRDIDDGEGMSGAVMRMPAFVRDIRKGETKLRRNEKLNYGKVTDGDDKEIWMMMREADVDDYDADMYSEEHRKGRNGGIGAPMLTGRQREGPALAAKRARKEARERRRTTPMHPTVV